MPKVTIVEWLRPENERSDMERPETDFLTSDEVCGLAIEILFMLVCLEGSWRNSFNFFAEDFLSGDVLSGDASL
jgi:hypothetical protein